MGSVYAAMKKCHLFDDIPEEKYENVLACLHARQVSIPSGGHVLNIGDKPRRAGLVLSGSLCVSICRDNGSRLVIKKTGAGQLFGENLLLEGAQESPVQIEAAMDSEILFMDFNDNVLNEECTCPYRAAVTRNLLREMSAAALFLNCRIQMIAQNRLRSRIRLYIESLPEDENGDVHLGMRRQELADYLCADRSALSREFGRMQEEGLIELHGDVVRILDPNFFHS